MIYTKVALPVLHNAIQTLEAICGEQVVNKVVNADSKTLENTYRGEWI